MKLANTVNEIDIELMEQSRDNMPCHPRAVEEIALSFLFLVALLTKGLFIKWQLRLIDLSDHLKLSIGVLEPLLAFMRTERLREVSRNSKTETASSYTLTKLGRLRAENFLQKCQQGLHL